MQRGMRIEKEEDKSQKGRNGVLKDGILKPRSCFMRSEKNLLFGERSKNPWAGSSLVRWAGQHSPFHNSYQWQNCTDSVRVSDRSKEGLDALIWMTFSTLKDLLKSFVCKLVAEHLLEVRQAWIFPGLDGSFSSLTRKLSAEHPIEAKKAWMRRARRLGLQDDQRLIWDVELAHNTSLRLDLLAAADLFLDSPGIQTFISPFLHWFSSLRPSILFFLSVHCLLILGCLLYC